MPVKSRFFIGILIAIFIVLSFGLGFYTAGSLSSPTTNLPPQFNALGEVWESLERLYVNKDALDPDKLSQGAIQGMLEALDDPYTAYIDAQTYQVEWSAFEGSFEGIGAVITMEDGQLTVVSPIAGSPAEEQGIRAGDHILEINGEPTTGMTLMEAVLKIRGPSGTKVTLIIQHPGETMPLEIEIVRGEVQLDSVFLEMLPDGIAYISISHFSERTHQELVLSLLDIQENGATGLVLDLRNNPGGYLYVAVDVADEFLEGGIVVYQQHSDGSLEHYAATTGGQATNIPMVVLVNGASASASEVLAGALQDWGRAMLVGTVTYGKGSINLVQELSDGSALLVTTARWLTPNGNLIEGIGLTPDFEVDISPEDLQNDRDTQLEFATQYLTSSQ